jgi:enoyl-CoA hydratase
MFTNIRYERLDLGYIKITLNRPQKRNAISIDLANELHQALQMAVKEQDIKFLVLTGEGNKAFSSGGDLTEFHGEMMEEEAYTRLSKIKEVLLYLTTFPLPTICLLNGHSRGGGCELATSCDFRYAKEGTNHGFVQGKLGIMPGFGGGALLYKRMDPALAYYWLVTSEVYQAETLKERGWIHQIYKDEDREEEILKPFIEKHPDQMKIFKSQLLSHPMFNQLKEEMEAEVRSCAKLWMIDEHKMAVEAFFHRKE